MTDLTVLCVTADADYAQPFLERLADDTRTLGARFMHYDGAGALVIEDILDDAIDECPDGYVLRIDDDETLSVALLEWLRAGKYRDADHWAFARRNLWPDAQHYVANAPVWPDLQTRLSVKAKSGGRTVVHQGSPHGTGRVAPDNCVIDHHKFLVRSREDRENLVRHYDRLLPGSGANFVMFSVPEMYDGELAIVPIG